MAILIELEVLPFTGFYDGIWGQGENEYNETHELKYGGYEDIESLQLLDDWGFVPNYRDQIAQMFAEAYHEKLEEMLQLNIDLIGAWVRSPKEYNFSTDEIYAQFAVDDYEALIKRVCHFVNDPDYRTKLGNIINKRHSSHDGFWSFMSNDIEDWYGLIQDPNINRPYLSCLIGYLLELMDPDWFETLNDAMYIKAQEDGLQETNPQTDEAKEEFDIYEKYGELYTKWADEHPMRYENPDKTSHREWIFLEWSEYKEMWLDYITKYETKQKFEAMQPVIPGLIDDETDISLT